MIRKKAAASLASLHADLQQISALITLLLSADGKAARHAAAQVCIEHSHFLMQIMDGDGNSPLHLAALTNDIEMCHSLVKSGAQMLARNASKDTPLDLARSKGHNDIVEYLEKQRNMGGSLSMPPVNNRLWARSTGR
mmetsp:Transcript_134208/g.244361  ORF Transcript_134208/g.244361 Transcript_134208/m.244361 type:complete len:137 (+) Transcript_134208:3-413(+)